jgi:LAGLIDADG-like domain
MSKDKRKSNKKFKQIKASDKLRLEKKFKHLKPTSDEELGHYLAGLLDGDGYIGNNKISICFYILDLKLAQYLVKRLGFGKIDKVKDKNAYNLNIYKLIERKRILDLVNGKLRGENKIKQVQKLLKETNFKLYFKYDFT